MDILKMSKIKNSKLELKKKTQKPQIIVISGFLRIIIYMERTSLTNEPYFFLDTQGVS